MLTFKWKWRSCIYTVNTAYMNHTIITGNIKRLSRCFTYWTATSSTMMTAPYLHFHDHLCSPLYLLAWRLKCLLWCPALGWGQLLTNSRNNLTGFILVVKVDTNPPPLPPPWGSTTPTVVLYFRLWDSLKQSLTMCVSRMCRLTGSLFLTGL